MTQSLEQKLIECLDALENGESLDVILRRYPNDAAQLRPFLETAVQLDQLPIQPTVAAQTASKQTFLEQAAVMKAAPAVPFWKSWQQWFRLATALAMFLMLFLVGAAYASTKSVPGDFLYNGKRFIEDVRLQAASPLQKIELADRYNQERITEINQLLSAGREEDVSFYGFIEAVVDDDTLTIADLTVLLNENTEIEGDVAVGYFAEVHGRTQNNAILAAHIIIASPSPAEDTTPKPEPTSTATPQMTATPTNTGTPTVTITATPTKTVTPTATATDTPTPTITPSPTETATPPPTIAPTTPPAAPDDDNSNEGEDNSNDNSGDDNSNEDADNSNDDGSNSNDDADNSNDDGSNSNDDADNSNDDDSNSNDGDSSDDDDSNDNNSND